VQEPIISSTIRLTKGNIPSYVEIDLPSSKSISNRLLILQNLSKKTIEINNLSKANDTQLLKNILSSNTSPINVEDAGTAARFSLAWACIKNTTRIISGTSRMHERPMKELIDALRNIGFQIRCMEQEGFMPVEISRTDWSKLRNEVSIDGSVSSQFISALCLIAPFLPNGLSIHIEGRCTSLPYLLMTLSLLKAANVPLTFEGNEITIEVHPEIEGDFIVEADWSAAAFWYGIVSHLPASTILLRGLTADSIQGDRKVVDLFQKLGVKSDFPEKGALISRTDMETSPVDENLMDNPDLAQPFIIACVLKNIEGDFRGLHTLRDKETDRIEALQNEILKINGSLVENNPNYKLSFRNEPVNDHLFFKTYNDHRMAMSLSQCVFTLGVISIENPEAVTKSYPNFWTELKKLGVNIQS